MKRFTNSISNGYNSLCPLFTALNQLFECPGREERHIASTDDDPRRGDLRYRTSDTSKWPLVIWMIKTELNINRPRKTLADGVTLIFCSNGDDRVVLTNDLECCYHMPDQRAFLVRFEEFVLVSIPNTLATCERDTDQRHVLSYHNSEYSLSSSLGKELVLDCILSRTQADCLDGVNALHLPTRLDMRTDKPWCHSASRCTIDAVFLESKQRVHGIPNRNTRSVPVCGFDE
jgi:hypothetical protein